jgi:hypothetical protein
MSGETPDDEFVLLAIGGTLQVSTLFLGLLQAYKNPSTSS